MHLDLFKKWPSTPIDRIGKRFFCEYGSIEDSCISGKEIQNLIGIVPHTHQNIGHLSTMTRFEGTQLSSKDEKEYRVQVDIKDVNLRNSFLCGYLTIFDLTEDFPNLTTFFEGEIIDGSKNKFKTDKWSADFSDDKYHWSMFPNLSNQSPFETPHFETDTNVYMRWKEQFLVPDHRIKQISGASYDGFYYICYIKDENSILGYYFHDQTEGIQKLHLKCGLTKYKPSFVFR